MWDKPVQVEAYASPGERERAIAKQVDEILERLDGEPPVAGPSEALRQARERAQRLKASQAQLVARTRELSATVAQAHLAIEERLLADAGAKIDRDLDRLVRAEAAHRVATRANRNLAERRIPEAEVEELSLTARFLDARAMALRAEAQLRLEKTAQLISQAAEFEGSIQFDPARTVSGGLTARAKEMETQAENYRRWAAERSDRHEKLLRETGG